jgi:hypothetical protein
MGSTLFPICTTKSVAFMKKPHETTTFTSSPTYLKKFGLKLKIAFYNFV